jgi:hypothetical protein
MPIKSKLVYIWEFLLNYNIGTKVPANLNLATLA